MGYKSIKNGFEIPEKEKFLDLWECNEEITGYSSVLKILPNYGIDPENIEISRNKYGKPEYHNTDLNFNFTNTSGLSVLAVCGYSSVGVDAEYIKNSKKYPGSVETVFTENEKKLIKNEKDFYKLWTVKEAFIKYKGTSIWFADNFDFSRVLISDENIWIKQIDCAFLSGIHKEKYFRTIVLSEKPELMRVFSY